MHPGQILVAEQNGSQVIKMIGDVRLTLCVSFDQFIESMFNGKLPCAIMFDLKEAECIDSTTLGLMAKIALLCRERCDVVPMVFSSSPSINRLLDTMGFEEIFDIVKDEGLCEQHKSGMSGCTSHPLGSETKDEASAKERVLEAHHILMKLNESNNKAFRDLVSTLEGH